MLGQGLAYPVHLLSGCTTSQALVASRDTEEGDVLGSHLPALLLLLPLSSQSYTETIARNQSPELTNLPGVYLPHAEPTALGHPNP